MLLATLLPDGIQAQSFKKELHAGKPECVVKYNDGKCTQLNGTTGWDGCKGVTQPNMLREYYTYKLGDTTFTPVLCGDKDAFADVDCNKSCKAIAKKNYAGGRCTEVQMNCPGGANNAKVGKCECDKGGGKFEDFPTKGKTDLLAFVTDGAYPGNFGGRAGADSYCQAAAASGGIAGTFRAILSDSTDVPFDAAGSIGFFGGELHDLLASPNMIVDTTDLLWSGLSLSSPFAYNEYGQNVGEVKVWTGSTSVGLEAQTCQGWTSNSSAQSGTYGLTLQNGSGWLSSSTQTCDLSAHLYCVQVRGPVVDEVEETPTPSPTPSVSPSPTPSPTSFPTQMPTPTATMAE